MIDKNTEQLTKPTKEEMIKAIRYLLCSVEGMCSALKSSPEHMSSYEYAKEVLYKNAKGK